MPFIEVKTIRGVFSTEEKSQMIEEITGVYARMKGDEFAAGTWDRDVRERPDTQNETQQATVGAQI